MTEMKLLTRREAALKLLTSSSRLTRKAGSFLGQVAVDPNSPLSEKQMDWLVKLLEQAGLPGLASDAE